MSLPMFGSMPLKVERGGTSRGKKDIASGDPGWRSHLPEAEAMVLMQQRTHLIIEQIVLDEKAAECGLENKPKRHGLSGCAWTSRTG